LCSVASIFSPKKFSVLFDKMQAFYPAKSKRKSYGHSGSNKKAHSTPPEQAFPPSSATAKIKLP
jgi:hypothetical protein